MAAGAITYIGYKIYDAYKITEAARQANEAWAQSYRNLNIDKLNLSDPDALMIGNMRIFNNELLTQNERIAQSTELWHRYWIEKNGPKQSVDDQTKFFDTAAGRDPELLKRLEGQLFVAQELINKVKSKCCGIKVNNINMEKNRKKQIVVLSIALVCIFILVFSLFHKSATKDSANPPLTNVLTDSISQIVSACPGEIGVAVIVNNRDTVKVNNKSVYPMMSVFKVHQALALCNDFDNKGISLDTLVNINRDKLDPKTWSPMLKDYSGPVISLTVRDLLRYTLTQSDNNASNLMFKDMVNVAQTDSFIATLIPRSSFQIAYTEEEMSADHNKAYSNYTSPLGAAMLMNRLFTEGLIDDEKQSFIKNTLKECKTGVDRIAAPLLDKEGVVIAHKTGSGDVNENGVLAAHNDVAYICLPNNISYTLAVFVKDFKGNESQASQYVAHISAVVYSLLMQTSVKS